MILGSNDCISQFHKVWINQCYQTYSNWVTNILTKARQPGCQYLAGRSFLDNPCQLIFAGNLCGTIFVGQSMPANLCQPIFGGQSLLDNCCQPIFAGQSLPANLYQPIFAGQSLPANLCWLIFATQPLPANICRPIFGSQSLPAFLGKAIFASLFQDSCTVKTAK